MPRRVPCPKCHRIRGESKIQPLVCVTPGRRMDTQLLAFPVQGTLPLTLCTSVHAFA